MPPTTLEEVLKKRYDGGSERGKEYFRRLRAEYQKLDKLNSQQGNKEPQARQERDARAPRIFKNYNLLRCILDRHEADIQKRWKKRTTEQKRNILLSAWGEGTMPKIHNEDWDPFRECRDGETLGSDRPREVFIWPFLNQEDLMKRQTLLLLMNSRGRHHPAEFAAADAEAIQFGLRSKKCDEIVLFDYFMSFTERSDAKTYGKLVHIRDPDHSMFALTGWKNLIPSEGLLVLESQDKTLDFLVGCAKQILNTRDDATLLSAAILPEPQISDATSWVQLALEAPYRVPSHVSFARLESLLKAKRDAIEDHIWSMREDPSYFVTTMTEALDHRSEQVSDSSGNPHPAFSKKEESTFWGRNITHSVIGSTLLDLEYWSELHRLAAKLKALQQQYRAEITPEQWLPDEYLHTILSFRRLIDVCKEGFLLRLQHNMLSSPPLRHHSTRDTDLDDGLEYLEIDTEDLDEVCQQFFWLLMILWKNDSRLRDLQMSHVMEELQRTMDKEPKVQAIVTPLVASQISDLAILAECLRQVDSYQPWAKNFDIEMIAHADEINKKGQKFSNGVGNLCQACIGSEKILARLGNPDDDKFYYPVGEKRTKESVEAMRRAETNLDALWRKVDELLHQKVKGLGGMFLRGVLLQDRSLQRTPMWVEPASCPAGKKYEAEVEMKPLSEVYFDLQLRTGQLGLTDKTNRMSPPKAKSKIKTRGQPAQNPSKEAEPGPQVEFKATQPIFAVDKTALKVFRTLFHTPSAADVPGEIKWRDFLTAMANTNFKSEKLYGSAWQFTPTDLDVETPIQFHEPHGGSTNGKLPFEIARRYGRRLTKHYGWHGGMFVLANKKSHTE